MADGDFFEFSIAHDRKYTLEHLWLQVLDDKAETVKIGISEFLRAEYGDIVRVVLTRPEDDSEFKLVSDAETNDDDSPGMMGSGDELGVDDLLITVQANYDGDMETILINSPVPCKILELNGEVAYHSANHALFFGLAEVHRSPRSTEAGIVVNPYWSLFLSAWRIE